MDISNMPDEDFKVMIIKIPPDLRKEQMALVRTSKKKKNEPVRPEEYTN